MDILSLCRKFFSTDNLYDVLSLPQRSASTQTEIKKAYRAHSLLLHPDKLAQSKSSPDAAEKFKVLNLVYSILMDGTSKQLYDESGIIKTETVFILSDGEMKEAVEKYAGSEIEKQEIREAFVRSCGNIKFVIESVPFLTAGDKPRVLQIIDKLIEKGEMSSREALKRQKDLQSKLKPKIEKEVKPSKPVTKPNQNLTLRQEALKNKKID